MCGSTEMTISVKVCAVLHPFVMNSETDGTTVITTPSKVSKHICCLEKERKSESQCITYLSHAALILIQILEHLLSESSRRAYTVCANNLKCDYFSFRFYANLIVFLSPTSFASVFEDYTFFFFQVRVLEGNKKHECLLYCDNGREKSVSTPGQRYSGSLKMQKGIQR